MQVDGAGWHHSDELVIPSNIRLITQPPYSPEVNPVEHIWDEVREKYFGNRAFPSLDALIEVLCQGLNELADDPERLRSLTGFPHIVNVNLQSADWYEARRASTMCRRWMAFFCRRPWSRIVSRRASRATRAGQGRRGARTAAAPCPTWKTSPCRRESPSSSGPSSTVPTVSACNLA